MTQRTYWHLEQQRRVPSDYEVVTSRLLYYPNRGFEVQSPVARWCASRQGSTALQLEDWDNFTDPRETTYSTYVERAQAREIFIDGLFESVDTSDYDQKLSPEWRLTLNRVLAPLRYPIHGLQMVAAYIGSMAPAGRIAVACAFQAADEMRLVQRLAYRTQQLRTTWAPFGEDSRETWQDDLIWQPLRKVVEKLLVTYDWTEALVILNLVIKPVLHELYLVHFGRLAAAHGDEILEKLLRALREDQLWHAAWCKALLVSALDHSPNRDRTLTILEQHAHCSRDLVMALDPIFSTPTGATIGLSTEQVIIGIQRELHKQRRDVGLAD